MRTVSGKGYRFTGQVQGPSLAEKAAVLEAKVEEAPQLSQRGPAPWAVWATLVLVVIFGSAVFLRFHVKPALKTGPPQAMLVVLPLVNLSGVPSEDSLADGMTEEIITQLGSLDPDCLGVVARISSMQYKTAQKTAAQVARELGVDYLLEGSVRLDNKRVRGC